MTTVVKCKGLELTDDASVQRLQLPRGARVVSMHRPPHATCRLEMYVLCDPYAEILDQGFALVRTNKAPPYENVEYVASATLENSGNWNGGWHLFRVLP